MNRILNKIQDYKAHNQGRAKIVLDILELSGILISFPLSILIVKNIFIPSWQSNIYSLLIFGIFLIISWYILSRITSLAKIPRTQRYRTVIFQFLRVNFIILVFLLGIKVFFRFTAIPLVFIFTYVGISFCCTLFVRLISYRFLKIYRAYGYNLHNVLIIADAFSDGIIEKLITQKEWGFSIATIITKSRLIAFKYGKTIPVVSETTQIKNIIDTCCVDEVIYCRKEIDEYQIKEMLEACNEVGVIFRLQSTASPLDPLDIQLKTINGSGYLTLVDIPSNNFSLLLKTISDIYFSIIAIFIALPFLLLIALAIKIDSRGPVFFKQERIGLRGRKFKLYKFRSMVMDAEHKLLAIKDENQADGPVFKIKEDPRITKVGKLLRKTGLDEIPQLYNIIKGEMSLIGPRPPLESEVRSYKRWQLRRLSVRPGITCSWQVIPNRHEVKFEKWMKMDLNYIDNWSLLQDMGLFIKTIRTLFLAGGH